MNDHSIPDIPDRPDSADADLRRQVRALKPSATDVDALSARVLAQWSERQGQPTTAPQHLGSAAGAAAALGLHPSRQRLWAGLTTGLVACAVIATAVWVQRPDPALEELLQADVLSQMAIGEM